MIGVLIYTLQVVYNKDLPSLAKQDEEIEARIFDRNCSKDYREDRKKFKGEIYLLKRWYTNLPLLRPKFLS